ncbi:MAG: signal peptide-containing protein [Chloroflexota bacterium]
MVFRKISVYVLLVGLSAIIGGIYGVLHDQISYTFSPEYFTQLKFEQFGLLWAYDSPRLGAAVVGWMATWWMGVIVSIFLGAFGFYTFETPKLMASNLVRAVLVVVGVALLTGLLGLAWGYIRVTPRSIDTYLNFIPDGVQNPVQFVRVGFMHNASYLGGLTGLLAGIFYLFQQKDKQEDSA